MSKVRGGPLRDLPFAVTLRVFLQHGVSGCFMLIDEERLARVYIEGGQVTFAACGAARGVGALESITLLMLDADFEFSHGVLSPSNETTGAIGSEDLPSVLASLERRQREFVEVIPSLGLFPRVAFDAPREAVELDRLALEILKNIDGNRSIAEIVELLGAPVRAIERTASLVRTGLVQVSATPLNLVPSATRTPDSTPFVTVPDSALQLSEPAARPTHAAVLTCALGCLGVGVGELLTAYMGARAGVLMDLGVVLALVALSMSKAGADQRLVLGLSIAPLVRITDLALSPATADSVSGLAVIALVVLLIGRELLLVAGPHHQPLAGKLLIVIAPLFVLFTILAGSRVIPLLHPSSAAHLNIATELGTGDPATTAAR
jgi:hypothetical protein